MAVAVKSVVSIAEDLLFNTQYKYLLTSKLSQDHLEIFFSKIRQRSGYNNNPNVIEFRTAMKKLLLKNSVSASYSANCILMDSASTESVFEIRWAKKKVDSSECEENFDNDNLTELDLDDGCFDVLKDNVLYYICGFIVKKIFKKIDCTTCAESLLEDPTLHSYCHRNSFSVFIDLKNRGGLVKTSVDVMKIVTFVEFTLIELTNNLTVLKSCLSSKIIINTKNHVFNSNIFKNLSCENYSFLETINLI